MNTYKGNNIVDESKDNSALLPLRSSHLFSLADLMRQFDLGQLAMSLASLTSLSRDLLTSDQISQPICTDERLNKLAQTLETLQGSCFSFDADSSLLRLNV
jgi:hypothetical protein